MALCVINVNVMRCCIIKIMYIWSLAASAYEMRVTTNLSMLRNHFMLAEELDVSGVNMTPNISGKVERLKMVVSSDDAFTSTTFFGVIAIDETGNRGPVSNIISITVGSSSVYKGKFILQKLYIKTHTVRLDFFNQLSICSASYVIL